MRRGEWRTSEERTDTIKQRTEDTERLRAATKTNIK